MTRHFTLALTCAALAVGGMAQAGGHEGNPAVKARKAHMQLYAFSLGTLGGMAKGAVEYDAAAAKAAADNLASLAALNQMAYWAPGTSMDDLGDQTEALPAIWQEGSKAAAIGGQLAEAAAALAAVAGDGQSALGPALGPVGQACGACHKAYRKPKS
ncbi:MAG: cytochrome c [Silicimonas sp.]|nr:cytochrome c [Silicimonas sp.]